jgi:hypothetical protein
MLHDRDAATQSEQGRRQAQAAAMGGKVPTERSLLKTVRRLGEGERMVDLPPQRRARSQRATAREHEEGRTGVEAVASKRACKANENMAGIDAHIKTHVVVQRISLAPSRQITTHAPLHIFHLPSHCRGCQRFPRQGPAWCPCLWASTDPSIGVGVQSRAPLRLWGQRLIDFPRVRVGKLELASGAEGAAAAQHEALGMTRPGAGVRWHHETAALKGPCY